MSFTGSMSAISHAATRVAAGAMTPISRRRQRRDRRSGEGAADNGSGRGERGDSIGSSGFGGWGSSNGGTDGWGGGGGGGGSGSGTGTGGGGGSGSGRSRRGSKDKGRRSSDRDSREASRSRSNRSGHVSPGSSPSRGRSVSGAGVSGGVRRGVADYAAQASAMADAVGLARHYPEREKPLSLVAGSGGISGRGDFFRDSGSGGLSASSSTTDRGGVRRSGLVSARGPAAAVPPSAKTTSLAGERRVSEGGVSRSDRRRSPTERGGRGSGAETASPNSVWSWDGATSARKGAGGGDGGGDGGGGGGGDGRLALTRREERLAVGRLEDDRGRPPSHVGESWYMERGDIARGVWEGGRMGGIDAPCAVCCGLV